MKKSKLFNSNSLDETLHDNKISQLIKLVEQIASYDFPCKVETDASKSPVDILANGLNMLGEEIENKIQELSEMRETIHNLENFSYTLAHDIKSPINNTIGILELMEMEVEEGNYSRIPEYINLLKSSNQKSLDMANGILEYAQMTSKTRKTEPINVVEMCSQITKELSYVHPISVTYHVDTPHVYYNPNALRQILSNLINNALKFNNKDECKLIVSCISRANDILISVQDNGPGIPEKFKDNIYNLFFRLNGENQPTGTGLGLAIIKKIVLENNGKIWTESPVGEGTVFCFTIPKEKI